MAFELNSSTRQDESEIEFRFLHLYLSFFFIQKVVTIYCKQDAVNLKAKYRVSIPHNVKLRSFIISVTQNVRGSFDKFSILSTVII